MARIRHPCFLMALLPALLLASAGQVRAQGANPAEVEDLIRQGNELRRAGKDPAAVPVFQKAYDLERSARTAAQLGLVEAQMGYWVAAERHLQEALAFKRHPWLDRNRTVVEETLKRVQSYIGELEVSGTPNGAEVVINGKVAGTLPLDRPIRVAEGPVQVGLRAMGHAPANTTVTVGGGQKERVALSLQRASEQTEGAAGPARAPVTAGEGPAMPAGPSVADEGTAADGPPAWVRPMAWVATAAAAVAVSVGAYGIISQREAKRDFESFGMMTCATALPNKGGTECQKFFNRSENARKMAIGGFVAGGALAIGAIVGFVVSADDGAPERRMSFAPAIGPDGAGASLSLRF